MLWGRTLRYDLLGEVVQLAVDVRFVGFVVIAVNPSKDKHLVRRTQLTA